MRLFNHASTSTKMSVICVFLLVTTFCVGALLSSVGVSADDSFNANVSLSIPVACTMTGTLNSPHSATVEAGTYRSDIGVTTLKTVCNDNSGFSIYAIGYSNNEYGNNKMIATVGGVLAPTYDIVTGTSQSGNTSNWAMKLNAVSGTYTPTILSDTNGSYASYHAVPDTYTKVATLLSNTDATNGASIQSTYAAYITTLQPTGSYNGKVRYTLVHPNDADAPLQPQVATSGCINYFPNGSNVEGTMGCQSISSSDTTATLLASNYSRSGYGFAGWSDAFDYATNANAHFYGPQEDVTFTAGQYTGTNDGLALYAVWVKSAGSLQDASKVVTLCGTGTGSLTTASTDGTANLASVSALTDQRDNQTYAIAKLADGKCWMIENLRLESTNSDNSTGALAQGYGTSATYGNFSGLATAESTGFTGTYSANSLYSNDGSNNTINIGASDLPAYRMPRYNNLNTFSRAQNGPNSNRFSDDNTTGGMYSYGNYYTWHAAIADTTAYNSEDHGTTSLCPTGWRLPIGNQSTANSSFGALSVALGGPSSGATADSNSTPTGTIMSKTFRSYPNNFLYSGYFFTSSAYSRGYGGFYWSSTAYSNNYSYYLYLKNNSVYPGTEIYMKNYGRSIRCTVSVGT